MEHSRNGVPPNYFDRAGEIIDKGAADEEEDQRVMELPAEDDVVTAPDPDHDDWDLTIGIRKAPPWRSFPKTLKKPPG